MGKKICTRSDISVRISKFHDFYDFSERNIFNSKSTLAPTLWLCSKESPLKITPEKWHLMRKKICTRSEKLVRKSKFWDHDFSSFLIFLTKWLIFRYKSNGTFCFLWPHKQPWYPFEGFKRPWFLTCIKKYENF